MRHAKEDPNILVRLFNRKWKVAAWLILAAIIYVPSSYVITDVYLLEVVGTEVRRVDASGKDVKKSNVGTKDVYFARFKYIKSDGTPGKVLVARNEDNALFYLKWNSADVQAELDALARCPGNRARVRFYGWRWQFMSMFPNVTSVVEVVDEGQCSASAPVS